MPSARPLSIALALCLCAAAVEAQAQTDAATDARFERDALAALRGRLERDAISTEELQSIVVDARALAARSSDARARAEALFYGADAADRARSFSASLALYRASLEAAPGARFAGRARARAATLAPNEADGFAGLSELERFRLRISSVSAEELRAFAARAATWSATPARVQARLLAASGLARLGADDDAVAIFRAIATDATSSSDDRTLALHELSRVRVAQGSPSVARDELRALSADRSEVAHASRLARRATLRRAAWVLLVAQWVYGLASVARAWRAGLLARVWRGWRRPLPLVHIGVLTVGGALLTRSYDHHDASHVWAFGAAVVTVYLSATAASAVAHGEAVRSRARTAGRVMLAVTAVLAASFLAMHRFDAGMLDGISL